jgi:hypothetical protein
MIRSRYVDNRIYEESNRGTACHTTEETVSSFQSHSVPRFHEQCEYNRPDQAEARPDEEAPLSGGTAFR